MSEIVNRREFLNNLWKWGFALVGAAGLWTTWDLIQPLASTGFGGKVRGVSADAVPEGGVIAIPAARAYLVKLDNEIFALSETCSHLGCRVPYCATSGQFECPCHGSVFNRKGEFLTGPAPRGMDLYPIEIEDGLVIIDTAEAELGPPPGVITFDEPPLGPNCAQESHG